MVNEADRADVRESIVEIRALLAAHGAEVRHEPEHAKARCAGPSDGRGGFRTCDLSRVKDEDDQAE
jgi:hypothetical protein